MTEFIKGADISTLLEVESCGGKYYDEENNQKDLISILKDHGFNYIRLRLWNNPYDDNGNSFGAGTCDLETVIKIAKRVKAQGLKILLDYHYSDFWTDPGKQTKPRAWANHSVSELIKDIYDFTYETLLKMDSEQVFPDMIQVGNELSAGLLWPEGRWPEFGNIAAFVGSGIKAVHAAETAVNKKSKIMIHLDNGGKNELYRTWFDNYMKLGPDFDIIGLSYYPFWHGSLCDLKNNMADIAIRYNKELVVAEVSMGFTMEDYAAYEHLSPENRKGYATKPELAARLPYEMSKEGQVKFTEDFLNTLKSVPEHKGIGFFWWEAGWLPVPGSGWATDAAIKYMNEKGPGGNEWANQALFDYDGHALPALNLIKDFKI